MHTERDQINNNPSRLDNMTSKADNIKAFLYMIRKCEGTAAPNGYRYLFGSRYNKEKLFDSFTDHPKIFFDYTDKAGKKLKTSAAGAYQITYTTWKALVRMMQLPDFSPESQDRAAIRLIQDAGALADIEAGHFATAINKVRKVWASLPASGSNQPERKMSDAIAWYQEAGGTISNLTA